MATVSHFGPYFFSVPGGIAPGEAYNIGWGPDDRFRDCSFNTSAHPIPDLRQTTYAMWVSDMSVVRVDVGQGDISNVLTTLTATFGNDGPATVTAFTVYLTVTTP